MPTNRLLLVSWSGFSRGALAKVVAQGGRVEAITPTRADSLEVRAKFLQHVETHPTRIALHVTDSEHERWLTQVPLQAALYSLSDGQEVGTVAMLVERLSYRSSEQISKDVYCHPERDALTHFTLGNDALEPAGLCVDLEGLRLPVLGIEVVGELQIGGHELPWEFWQLGPALFAIAEIEMATGPVLYVLSPREDGSETLSWRPLA